MNKIRVLLAVQPPLLCELLAEWFQDEPEVEIVGTAQDPISTLVAVREMAADVVVTITHNDEMPVICTHLFGEFPSLVVVAISTDASCARVFRQQICETPLATLASHDLVTSMRQALADLPPGWSSSPRLTGSTAELVA